MVPTQTLEAADDVPDGWTQRHPGPQSPSVTQTVQVPPLHNALVQSVRLLHR